MCTCKPHLWEVAGEILKDLEGTQVKLLQGTSRSSLQNMARDRRCDTKYTL